MNILVTGVTGYVGARLVPRLRRDGHTIRGFARSAPPAELGIDVVRGDAVTGRGLDIALDGIDAAYYLIHSMEPGAENRSFSVQERVAAENFAREAERAGVKRVIYLGGLMPAAAPASAHLASRHAVEQLLLGASPCSIALRASIVIGARSRSFRFLVRLVERLPVIALPGWRNHRTRPIDERDVIEILARSATIDGACHQSIDIAGPDTVTYEELIDAIQEHMLIARPTIALGPLTVTPIASRIAAVISGESHELVGPLMEGLVSDLLPRDDHAAELFGVRLHPLDAAIERALREWETEDRLAAK